MKIKSTRPQPYGTLVDLTYKHGAYVVLQDYAAMFEFDSAQGEGVSIDTSIRCAVIARLLRAVAEVLPEDAEVPVNVTAATVRQKKQNVVA